jgi:hypothetical protein
MRKLVAVLCGFGILFLVGCADTERQDRRNALTAARQARPNLMERIDGPADAYIYKFETEFSDGTRVGCVTVSSYYNVDCVTLTGSDL